MFFQFPNCSWSLAMLRCPKDTSGRTSAGCAEVVGGLRGAVPQRSTYGRAKKPPARPRNVFSFLVQSPGKIGAPRLEALPRAGRLLLALRPSQTLGCSQEPRIDRQNSDIPALFPFISANLKGSFCLFHGVEGGTEDRTPSLLP